MLFDFTQWSTWQWVFIESLQFFRYFDIPETPGSAFVVFADNQSKNEILQQIEAIPPSVQVKIQNLLRKIMGIDLVFMVVVQKTDCANTSVQHNLSLLHMCKMYAFQGRNQQIFLGETKPMRWAKSTPLPLIDLGIRDHPFKTSANFHDF